MNRREHFGNFEILNIESIDYFRYLTKALVIRFGEANSYGIVLSLDEKLAWKKLFELIDPSGFDEHERSVLHEILNSMQDMNSAQATVELGKIAHLDP